MKNHRHFYINGEWVPPAENNDFAVLNPATEEQIGVISLGSAADINCAVIAAQQAFGFYSEMPFAERISLLRRITETYQSRMEEISQAISLEMGCPISLSRTAQAPAGLKHLTETIRATENLDFESQKGSTLMRKEPIGVCALITPWNWPMNQIVCKVAPALAAGCAMVLKPSEFAPLSAHLFSEILDQAGVPPGVFNMVYVEGTVAGAALVSHPDVAMVSFTGSTKAGIAVACAAAPTVKRVTQELGGKSANIILADADFSKAVEDGVQACFRNTGQSCNSPTRMLVPAERISEASSAAKRAAENTTVGDPFSDQTAIGPLVNEKQFQHVQRLIKIGIQEGAKLVAGGTGRPPGFNKGHFCRPTVFSEVSNEMTIAREEIFGPVLCIIPYRDEEDAIRIANDSPYGLSGFVSSRDMDHARRVAKRIRSGNVHINNARVDFSTCFGGYKQSGNGREWGEAGLEEFLELKAIFGYGDANTR